jgi:hypothetical protein
MVQNAKRNVRWLWREIKNVFFNGVNAIKIILLKNSFDEK